MLCRRLFPSPSPRHTPPPHTTFQRLLCGWVLGGEATATGECERYPHGPSAAACRPVVQLSRGETLTPGPAQLLSTDICLCWPSLSAPARVFADLGCWFLQTSSFAIWSILPHWYPASCLCPRLPWPGLALFKRRARIGLCRRSGGSVRGGGWLVGCLLLAASAFVTGQTSFACMGDGVMGGTMRHYGCSTHQRESAVPVVRVVRIVRIASHPSGVQRE